MYFRNQNKYLEELVQIFHATQVSNENVISAVLYIINLYHWADKGITFIYYVFFVKV